MLSLAAMLVTARRDGMVVVNVSKHMNERFSFNATSTRLTRSAVEEESCVRLEVTGISQCTSECAQRGSWEAAET